jgi:glutamate-1-semialdehyde 2,1-aminomutase
VDFIKSDALARRLAELVPGGGHTYAKGSDQYPSLSPGVLVRGHGCHVWDADGNEFIEYGMGLRSVGLGHAYPAVVEAVREALDLGTNFTRPASVEVDAAERLLDIIPTAEMVKFTKDGSTATTAAIRLARRATGREVVAMCDDHPFFSYDDWFISTTTLSGGIPAIELRRAEPFRYNDLDSVRSVFDQHRGRVAAVILEPVRLVDPEPGFLPGLRQLCDEHGALLVFDEMITGFRFALHGAQAVFGVTPDLSTFGKALANGFAVSALCGKAEYMRLGGRGGSANDVFLLSTTHGAEIPGLVAALATMAVYQSEPVIEHLYRQGQRLSDGLRSAASARGLEDYVAPLGFPCNLVFSTAGPDGKPSQAYRTLFLQELTRRGVLAPSLVVSFSHTDADVDRTIEAIDAALSVYAKAMDDGTEPYLVGPPSSHVFDRRWG